MLGRLHDWLFDRGGREALPERVRDAIRQQQEQSEILIGWIQLSITILVGAVYEGTSMAEGLVQADYSLEVEVLLIYGAICILRLVLAYLRLLRPWMLYLSVIADVALLMGLIYSFHYKYAQPAAFYLKVPTLLYVFLFIALRALRFEARFVVFAGVAAAAGWAWLTYYVASGRGGPPNRTHNFVEYMTSNALLVGAEIDKIIAILLATIVLALAISRASSLVRGPRSRPNRHAFSFSPGSPPASAGGDLVAGANCATSPSDRRLCGFALLSTTLAPAEVMKGQDYQGRAR
jgi:adenylate cyclase